MKVMLKLEMDIEVIKGVNMEVPGEIEIKLEMRFEKGIKFEMNVSQVQITMEMEREVKMEMTM